MKKEIPFVQLVTPVYNAEKHLQTCLSSVIDQTYQNLRIILVDDGSTDSSGAICDNYAAKDARITVIHQENQGSVAARCNGTKACSDNGYICFCDADDVMPHNAIENLVAHADPNGICVGRTDRIWRRLKLKSRFIPPCFQIDTPRKYTQEEFISQLYCSWFGISNVPVSLCAKLFPAQLIKEAYDKTPNVVRFYGDDLTVTLNAMPLAESITIIPDVIYHYRPGGGTSRYNAHMMDDWIALYNYKADFSKKYPMPQDTERLMDIELCNMAFTFFYMLGRSRKLDEAALKDMITSTCQRPELQKAAQNPRIGEKFGKDKLIKHIETEQIFKLVYEDTRQEARFAWLKYIYYKFA